MGKDRFDFSEIDAALPAAERMQEKDRLTDALENNYRAVGILGDRVEKLESRLSEVLPGLDEAISSLGGASKITISAESRRVLEQEGEAICRKMAEGERQIAQPLVDERLRGDLRYRLLVHDRGDYFSFGGFHLHLHDQCRVYTQPHAVESARLFRRFSCRLRCADCFYIP